MTHKSERLYGLSGTRAARAILEQRLRQASEIASPSTNLTVLRFVDHASLTVPLRASAELSLAAP